MTARSKTAIKAFFETGDVPTQTQFGDLIDSYMDVGTLIDALRITVTQSSHGLAAGDVVRMDGTTYVKAQADSAVNAEVIGVVESSADANTFVLVLEGEVTLSGLTAGALYYLSAGTAGAYTATEPSTTGNISKPVFVALTTTTAKIVSMRGLEVGVSDTVAGSNTQVQFNNSGSFGGAVGLTYNATTRFTTFAAAAITGREQVAKFTVSDVGDDALFIANGTSVAGVMAPVFAGYQDGRDSLFSMSMWGLVSAANDSSDTADFGVIDILCARTSSASDPLNGTLSNLANRKVLTIRKGPTENVMLIDVNGNMRVGTGLPSSKLDVGGDVEIGSSNYFYLGDPSSDTSWRIGISGDDLVFQQRESGVWNTKNTMSGA